MTSRPNTCASCGLRWKPGHQCPTAGIVPDMGAAADAYLDAFRCGDADAYMEMTAYWTRWPASDRDDALALDRAQGYADGYSDGYSQQIASQEGAQS
jgi:hypothetical protein